METQEIFRELNDLGYIDFGKHIPSHVIEKLIGKKFRHGDWEFIADFLALKECIEDNGYFCTSRKQGNGSLRILHVNEWERKLENVQKTALRRQKKAINTVNNADLGQIDEKEKSILAHELNKLSMGLQAMRSVLYDL